MLLFFIWFLIRFVHFLMCSLIWSFDCCSYLRFVSFLSTFGLIIRWCDQRFIFFDSIHAIAFFVSDDVVTRYKNARLNLTILNGLGASVLHGVDATKMKYHTDLHMRKFDRIIFNFPHAGFFGRGDSHLMIRYILFILFIESTFWISKIEKVVIVSWIWNWVLQDAQ